MKKQRKNHNPPIARICITCGDTFYIPPSDLKYGRGKFCSRKCYTKTGEGNPKWRGGRVIRDGYVYIYQPSHPNATKAGYVCEHRLVMEKEVGRILKRCEYVHHINENTQDNSISNLMIVTHRQHQGIHIKGKKQSPEHIQKRFANRKPQDISKYPRNSLGRFI